MMRRLGTKDHMNNVEVVSITKDELTSFLGGSQDYSIQVVVSKTELVSHQVGTVY